MSSPSPGPKARWRGGPLGSAPDICDAGTMQHLCRGLHDRWGGLGGWFHAAVHVPPLSPATMADEKDFAKSLATNVTALQRLIPYIDPLLRAADGGHAVFFDDPMPPKFAGAYLATKAAQRALVQSWQAEATTEGAARVHLLTPRPMPTATRARFHPGEDRAGLTTTRAEAARLMGEIGL